jgi:hypothetical protein
MARTRTPARRAGAAAALAVLVALVAAAPAAAQYFGQNKLQDRRPAWRVVESDHFLVHYPSGLDSLGLRVLDLAEKTDELLGRRLGHRLGRRVPVIVYGSHHDFAQTNVITDLIGPGTGGFTEVLHNRVVLPFTGSYEDLRHVVVHELTHAYLFDLLYGGSASRLLAEGSFFAAPLWFSEGLAEHLSLGMEPDAEMFLRDGIVTGYLPPLERSGGYLVYKQGQSAVGWLVARHGEERLRRLLRELRRTRGFDRAFQRVMGMPVRRFDEQWRDALRRAYWPEVAQRRDPERFARQLTDHRRDGSAFNTAPAISPQGDRIAWFSDRRQYTDVYVMSAYDGKVLRRVIRGERGVHFESIPSFRSALTWSPDGRRLALTAKSGGRDALVVVAVEDGRVLRRLRLDCDALAFPAWSPVTDSVVVTGLKDGRSDLWLVDTGTGEAERLTDDAWDEKEACWTPDGRAVTFASDRLAPVVLRPERDPDGFGRYGLYDLDLAERRVGERVVGAGDVHAPAWSPDGRKLAYLSDRGGASDILLLDTADGSVTQLTEVLGGIASLSWSRQDDRLVFSAFHRGGYDVFAVREPVGVDAVLARLRRETPGAVLGAEPATDGAPGRVGGPRGALGDRWRELATGGRDSLGPAGPADSARAPALRPVLAARERGRWPTSFPVYADTVPVLPARAPLRERGGPFALPESVLAQAPSPYRGRLSADYATGGVLAATGFGVMGTVQAAFSDLLGDHRLHLAADVLGRPLDETNGLLVYSYLPRRWDLSAGVFHFLDAYSARYTTTGEALGSTRVFTERSFGGLLGASRPFDRFRRLDLELSQVFVERRLYEEDEQGWLREGERRFETVTSPAVSLVGDNTLWGWTGPVNGARYRLTAAPSFAWLPHALAWRSVTLDARHYWDLTRGYVLAARVLAARSDGRDARAFLVGGFSTLRGQPLYGLAGTRVALGNAELRFPFIDRLGVVGPLPLGSFALRGALFADLGMVWDRGEPLRLTRVRDGVRRLASPVLSFGAGVRTTALGLVVKLDAAWRTDLADVARPRWEFSVGPEF